MNPKQVITQAPELVFAYDENEKTLELIMFDYYDEWAYIARVQRKLSRPIRISEIERLIYEVMFQPNDPLNIPIWIAPDRHEPFMWQTSHLKERRLP